MLGMVPELSSLLAEQLVLQAWSDIRSEKDRWSFLTVRASLTVPDVIAAGSVTLTQDSASVTADATAKTALDAVAADLPNRIFRGGNGAPIYEIASYNSGTGVITLSEPYYEAAAAGAAYQVYKAYEVAPVTDFKVWKSIVDPVNSRWIKVNYTKQEIDLLDPQRGSVGDPFCLAAHVNSASGVPRYEWWPHPTARRRFLALYQRLGTDLSDSVDLPPTMPRALLQDRALWRGYEWAEANKDRFQSLQNANWQFLMGKVNRSYQDRLKRVKVEDDNLYNQQFGVLQGQPALGWDADYLQSHDPPRWA
jgi:hypothetical protein